MVRARITCLGTARSTQDFQQPVELLFDRFEPILIGVRNGSRRLCHHTGSGCDQGHGDDTQDDQL